MAQSPDHPELVFVQARYYAKGRPDGPPLWIVVHDMEASEYSGRAESTAEYFRTMTDGRTVSSHYTVDDDSVVQCVLLQDTAFTVGNRPGNYRGINWEFSGFARQTRAEWLDPFGAAMFAQAAPIIRSDMARYNIPLRRCTVADLQSRRPGITSHNDLRLAFGGTTHTDPGPNFPWDVFLEILGEDDDMTPEQDSAIIAGKLDPRNVLHFRLRAIQDSQDPLLAETYPPEWMTALPPGLRQISRRLDVLEAGTVDPAVLKAVLLDPQVLSAIAKAVADEDHRRSAA